MPVIASNNSICQCSFGAAPAVLQATSAPTVMAVGQPAATIMDLPKIPFVMCQSLANPAVASATAAALGVLTPMPCTPVVPAPWMPGSPTVLIGGKPALNQSCKVMCAYGGVIQITMSPALTVQVP
jgi:uncharacterized Zn-binding protein involved in type VI secretion